jgi:hypothetical protein
MQPSLLLWGLTPYRLPRSITKSPWTNLSQACRNASMFRFMIITEFTAYALYIYISSRFFLIKMHLSNLPALFAMSGLSFDACFFAGRQKHNQI